jgi:hypothetical protein
MPRFIELGFLAPCSRHVLHPYAAGFRQRCFVDLVRAVHWLALCFETEGRGIVRLPHVNKNTFDSFYRTPPPMQKFRYK